MADIRLAKPAAGAAETVPCAPEARFVFDFPATDATLARDGDNLAIQFEDGSRLNLEGFYTEYNEDNLPSFSIDGTEVAAADFFAAMNEPDLMPAAGPGAGTPTGGRFHEWGNASLAAGLDHLDGLDLSTGRAFTFDDTLNAVGGAPATDADNDVAPTDTVTVTTSFAEPTIIYANQATSSQVTVDEGDLAHGSRQDTTDATKDFTATSPGSFTVDLDSADGVITIGDTQFSIKDGMLPETTGVTIDGKFGKITSVSFSNIKDSSRIKVEYTYELTKRTESTDNGTVNGKEGPDGRGEFGEGDSFAIKVETSAGKNEGSINVSVLDDAPHVVDKIDFNSLHGAGTSFYDTDTAISFQIGGGQGNAVKLDNVNFGADVTSKTGETSAFVLVTVKETRAGASLDHTYKASVTRDENGNLQIGEFTQDKLGARLSYNQEEGIFSFTPADGLVAGSSYQATIRIEDADGDFTLLESDRTEVFPSLPESVSVMVSEAGSTDGSHSYPEIDGQQIKGTAKILKLPEGWEFLEASGEKEGMGRVEQTSDGSLQYVLTGKLDHLGQDQNLIIQGGDTVKLTLADPQGTKHTVEVKIDILDDAPVITVGDGTYAVTPTESFPYGQFDFTFGGNHETYKSETHKGESLWEEDGWQPVYDSKYSVIAAKYGDLTISGGLYTYETDDNGNISLVEDRILSVIFSNSNKKESDKNSVSQGLHDGLTVGSQDDNNQEGGFSQFEIGAAPGTNQAEGLCFDLGGKTAHSVTVNLGAFFSAGSGDDLGKVYDPIPECALLTFYDGNDIVKQMKITASSDTGLYTETIDCYVAGGFNKFVVSALDNNPDKHSITSDGALADSDFVVQSVEFHTIIGTATGKLGVTPGADGLHADMHGYAALFDLAAMRETYAKLTFEQDGMNGFIAKDGDKTIFAASIDEHGNWTLTQFNHCNTQDITLHFYTKDGDNDISPEQVKVLLYQGENASGVQDAMDTDGQDSSFYATVAADDDGNGVLFGDGDNTSPEQLAQVIGVLQGENVDAKADALVTAMKKITGEEPEKFDVLGKTIDEKFSRGDAETGVNDTLRGGNGDDVLLGMGGDDRLMGNAGDDYLFGGSGNDYLHGGEGKDYLNGGAGSDLLVYDAEDYLIDGGAGLDILLAGNNVTDSLDSLLKDGNVQNVEVLLKGEGALSLTSMQELAEKYGIEMSADGNSLFLTRTDEKGTNGWKIEGNGSYSHYNEEGEMDLTMETANLTVQEPASSEAEQAAHTLSLAQG